VAGRKPDADSPAGTAVLGAAVVQAEQLAGPVPHQIQILASRFGSPQDRLVFRSLMALSLVRGDTPVTRGRGSWGVRRTASTARSPSL
jgi:hypothetical protein